MLDRAQRLDEWNAVVRVFLISIRDAAVEIDIEEAFVVVVSNEGIGIPAGQFHFHAMKLQIRVLLLQSAIVKVSPNGPRILSVEVSERDDQIITRWPRRSEADASIVDVVPYHTRLN